jgi:hypothetical protein
VFNAPAPDRLSLPDIERHEARLTQPVTCPCSSPGQVTATEWGGCIGQAISAHADVIMPVGINIQEAEDDGVTVVGGGGVDCDAVGGPRGGLVRPLRLRTSRRSRRTTLLGGDQPRPSVVAEPLPSAGPNSTAIAQDGKSRADQPVQHRDRSRAAVRR